MTNILLVSNILFIYSDANKEYLRYLCRYSNDRELIGENKPNVFIYDGLLNINSSNVQNQISVNNREIEQIINNIFEKFGLKIFDKTPDLGMDFDRPDEVNAWLKATAEVIESFVIIDDYRYGWGKLFENFVKTNPNFGLGLEEEHVRKAIEILEK